MYIYFYLFLVDISVAVNTRSLLGESPHYDPLTKEVIWVDCDGKEIHFYNTVTQIDRKFEMKKKVAVVIPCKTGTDILALMEKSICLVDRNSGEVRELCTVESDKPLNRFNDGKCDPQGRLWYGTLYPAPAKDIFANNTLPSLGGLYTYDGVIIKQHLNDVELSNGLDWSVDGNTFYYINSIPKKVYSFDFDCSNGTITNQRVIIDYNCFPSLGYPDGMCRDSEGMLWIAGICGGNVTRWNPLTGDKLLTIDMPVRNPTACCFGGPNYDVLYVTSGMFGSSQEELETHPYSGSLFAISGLGITGIPGHTFDNSKLM